MVLFHMREGEIALRKWMMDKDTLVSWAKRFEESGGISKW